MIATKYQVDLPQFQGPLDLLLGLVDKEKLDITEISLAKVASQYQQYLETLERLNLELESSYLVVFAQLLEIKSKVLLPPEPQEEWYDEFNPLLASSEEDEENDLVEQLKNYKLLKDATELLAQRQQTCFARFPRVCTLPEPDVPELDVSLEALAAAWVRMDTSARAPRQPVELKRVEISVPDRVKQVWSWLCGRSRGFFSELLGKNRSKSYVVVTFLAVLELVRRSQASARQEGLDGDIQIILLEGSR